MSKHVVTAKVYDKRGTLIAQARNSYTKSHPLMAHFARLANQPERVFLHAEVAALLKCKENNAHSIVIERFKKDGTPGNAKPCPICERAIKAWGIQRITYTIG